MILDDYLQFKRIKIITHDDEEYVGTPAIINHIDKSQSGQNEILLDVVFDAKHKFVRLKQNDIRSIEILHDEKHISIVPDIVPYECRKCGIGKMEIKCGGRIYICSNPDCTHCVWLKFADKE